MLGKWQSKALPSCVLTREDAAAKGPWSAPGSYKSCSTGSTGGRVVCRKWTTMSTQQSVRCMQIERRREVAGDGGEVTCRKWMTMSTQQ